MTRVLVIEDNRYHAELIHRTLTRAGMEVTHVSTAEEALKNEAPYDLVLCDISLPGGMGGLEFAEAARKLPAFSRLPMIAMSVHALSEHRASAISAGFDGFFDKPIDIDLAAKLMAFLK